jgi:hypothetical protein
MAIPISGPYRKTIDNVPGVQYDMDRRWYRQKKPYDLDLYYRFQSNRIVKASFDAYTNSYFHLYPSPQKDAVVNKAYSKLIDEIGSSSLWSVNLLESHQSIDMIRNRALQLARFTRRLNRFDFLGAAKELGLAKFPKGLKAKANALGNNWLEYHFGWEPLVKDIGAALEVFNKAPLEKKLVRGRANSSTVYSSRTSIPGSLKVRSTAVTTKVHMKVEVRVNNPDLYLLNQLGFVNPLVVAWERIPFSFVVDWFANVGQVLSASTDFFGLEVTRPMTTVLERFFSDSLQVTGPPLVPPPEVVQTVQYESIFMQRDLGIISPVLRIAPLKRVSPVRAATAISLLLQQLKHA